MATIKRTPIVATWHLTLPLWHSRLNLMDLPHTHRIKPRIYATFIVCLTMSYLACVKALPATNSGNFLSDWATENLDPQIMPQLTEVLGEIGLADSVTVSNFLKAIDIKTEAEKRIADLRSGIRKSELQLKRQQRLLVTLNENIEVQMMKLRMLNLTPEQLSLIQQYNRSVSHDPSFIEWIVAHQTWFDTCKDWCLECTPSGIEQSSRRLAVVPARPMPDFARRVLRLKKGPHIEKSPLLTHTRPTRAPKNPPPASTLSRCQPRQSLPSPAGRPDPRPVGDTLTEPIPNSRSTLAAERATLAQDAPRLTA